MRQIRALAATSLESCAMSVNGLDLFAEAGCALDRLVVGRDGVCAAVVDFPSVPRAACFDTKNEADGAGQLASWIDSLPFGATTCDM